MSNTAIIIAGCLGMSIAMVHGYLGAAKVVAPIEGIAASSKRILHAIFFLSAVYWFIGGAVLVAAPFYLSDEARQVAAILVGAMYLSGAIANFWGTKGRHFGWMLLSVTVLLIWLGR